MIRIEEYSRVWAEVDLDAIESNMVNMKKNINENTQMIGVIKTDGYGHGAVPIARRLEKLDFMWGFAVATPEEAMILRRADITLPILILGYTFPYSYDSLIRENIRPAVFKRDMLDLLDAKAGTLGVKASIHIKLDTGMGRIGIRPNDEGLEFVRYALGKENINVEGIFTHFARADELDKSHAEEQLMLYNEFIERIQKELGADIPIKHCSNSAGILELPEANKDIVRAGITLYGLMPSSEVSGDIVKLTPAMSLYSTVVYIKELEPGQSVSYGGTFTADHSMRIATIPVGYGDGYPRGLSNKGYVLIRGQRARILGRVCMDQFMVDVTELNGVEEGDTVTLMGRDGELSISAEELGELSGRFNYEFVCDLGKRIPRVYVSDGRVVETADQFRI